LEQLTLPAGRFVDLLADRREGEAAQFVRHYAERAPLRSIYTGIYEAGLEETDRRSARGELTAAQREFMGRAIERIMSVTAPALMATEATRDVVICASFDSDSSSPQVGIAAALLMLEGFDVCHPWAESPVEDLERIVDEIQPAFYVFSATSAKAHAALARVSAYIRAGRTFSRPFIIVLTNGPADHFSWKRLHIDVLAKNATTAVEAVLRARTDARERRA
jgi:methanogenic corrinoid protein MtbC1